MHQCAANDQRKWTTLKLKLRDEWPLQSRGNESTAGEVNSTSKPCQFATLTEACTNTQQHCKKRVVDGASKWGVTSASWLFVYCIGRCSIICYVAILDTDN